MKESKSRTISPEGDEKKPYDDSYTVDSRELLVQNCSIYSMINEVHDINVHTVNAISFQFPNSRDKI